MSRAGGPCCDPERVFELADGELPSDEEGSVRAHLNGCPSCRDLYEEELELNARIGSVEMGESRSVCREVAMALPTRLAGVRIVWAGLATVLLIVASLALSLDGTNPASPLVGALGAFWGFVAGLSDVVESLLVTAGPVLLLALGVGAVVDLTIAVVILSIARRRAREA